MTTWSHNGSFCSWFLRLRLSIWIRNPFRSHQRSFHSWFFYLKFHIFGGFIIQYFVHIFLWLRVWLELLLIVFQTLSIQIPIDCFQRNNLININLNFRFKPFKEICNIFIQIFQLSGVLNPGTFIPKFWD